VPTLGGDWNHERTSWIIWWPTRSSSSSLRAEVRGADDGLKPGVKRSGTQDRRTEKTRAREAGDSSLITKYVGMFERGSAMKSVPPRGSGWVCSRIITLKALANSSPGFALKPWVIVIVNKFCATLKGLRRTSEISQRFQRYSVFAPYQISFIPLKPAPCVPLRDLQLRLTRISCYSQNEEEDPPSWLNRSHDSGHTLSFQPNTDSRSLATRSYEQR